MELFNLNGKTALITGASTGIGEKLAKALDAHGVRVIICARNYDKLAKLAKNMNNALAVQMDVADKKSIYKVFSELEKHGEKIDICINNAGIAGKNFIFEEDNNQFEEIIQTNVLGLWHVTRAVSLHMKNNSIAGSIINISSVGGDAYSQIGLSAYCSSKAAVTKLTKALVGELAAFNIRINAILPGTIATNMTAYKVGTAEKRAEFALSIPLKFVAEPEDLVGAVIYLASNNASRYVTGSSIIIDGGSSWGGKV